MWYVVWLVVWLVAWLVTTLAVWLASHMVGFGRTELLNRSMPRMVAWKDSLGGRFWICGHGPLVIKGLLGSTSINSYKVVLKIQASK